MDLLDAGRRRWWMSAAAVLLVAAAAVVVVVLWLSHRGGASPDDVAREFLDARSCPAATKLADSAYRARLDDRATGLDECHKVTDGARGLRTFGSTDRTPGLRRTLSVGDSVVQDDEATVTLQASYARATGRAPAPELVVVVLHRESGDWRVDHWGLAS